MRDVIEYIESNVRLFPNNIAVIDMNKKISYLEFSNTYKSYSAFLTKFGDNPKVIIDLIQGVEAYALIIACLNIGATFCTLNPETPIKRKKQIIAELSPDVIVARDINPFKELEIPIINIDDVLKTTKFDSNQTSFDNEQIIYILYTSGSTGNPKGVLIRRKGINKFLEWSIPTFGADNKDVWAQFSLLSFDLSLVDILTCLASGAQLLVMNDLASKLRPLSFIEKNNVTIWHSIPSAIEFMIKNNSKSYNVSSLRIMSFCGEPLREHQVQFLFQQNRNIIIYNTYGPTEGTLFCTYQEIRYKNYKEYCNTTISIGRPIPGWNFLLKKVEGFEEREIVIYGDFIAKGYLTDDVDKFKRLEFDNKFFDAFETGDLVTEENGNLYFSCRKDRQVKIKGHRIELDEIDYWNRKFLNKTSISIVKENTLISFIESDEPIDEKKLKDFLLDNIEPYKIPQYFRIIKQIPRNQNLKVNYNTLNEIS